MELKIDCEVEFIVYFATVVTNEVTVFA